MTNVEGILKAASDDVGDGDGDDDIYIMMKCLFVCL